MSVTCLAKGRAFARAKFVSDLNDGFGSLFHVHERRGCASCGLRLGYDYRTLSIGKLEEAGGPTAITQADRDSLNGRCYHPSFTDSCAANIVATDDTAGADQCS